MNLEPDNLRRLSEKVSVILVEPKYQGNVGAVARLLKNFGLTDLVIVNFEDFTDESISRAMGGKDILLNARRVDSFEDAIRGFDIVAGTSSTVTGNYKKFRRIPMIPSDFWDSVSGGDGKIALVFGREDDGLRNEELEKCNYFLHIPANPDFPVLNLSHAVSVVLYDMARNIDLIATDPVREANGFETEQLLDRVSLVMEKTGYPDYRVRNTIVMLRRMIGRSSITESEFYKIMGIIRGVLRTVDPGSENE